MWGEVIGSVIGGLLGRKKTKSPGDQLMSHAKGAREAADRTGFNPLTLLGVQPQGYTETGGPAFTSGSFIAEAIGRAADTYFNTGPRVDPVTEMTRRQVEVATLAAQRRAMNPYQNFGYDLTTQEPFGQDVRVRLPALSTERQKADGPFTPIPVPDPLLNRGTGVFAGPLGHVEAKPGWSPAAIWEEEYGEVGAALYGLAKMGVDAGYNARQWTDRNGWTEPGNVFGNVPIPKLPTRKQLRGGDGPTGYQLRKGLNHAQWSVPPVQVPRMVPPRLGKKAPFYQKGKNPNWRKGP